MTLTRETVTAITQEADELAKWFSDSAGFSCGTKAPHKWVLQADQELRRVSTLATGLLAAWYERDTAQKLADAMEEEAHAHIKLWGDALRRALDAEAKLAERDAENARLRDAATGLAKWVICNIPSGEVVDEKLRALDAALTGDKP